MRHAPAVQSLARRVENGGAQTFFDITPSAQPFFAALMQQLFPQRTLVIVTENLKRQETLQQDLETWLASLLAADEAQHPNCFFYPAWEILPHEGKLPPADVISDRLQTLIALGKHGEIQDQKPPVIVASVESLLQKTFAPEDLKNRARQLKRGDKIVPLDLIEWLELQGYEPEAQVTQRGEMAMRGGIVDIYPPTSPWPVRLEFFGDELESLRYFDPLTQISREEISGITLPPAGELGILKVAPNEKGEKQPALATLLDHVPRDAIFILCDPESLTIHAENYAQQLPADDPFFIAWPDWLNELTRRGFTALQLFADADADAENRRSEIPDLKFDSLDAFRPLAERAPEPQIAEMQRREFFQQIHRWLRQDYAVHIFCNNDGEQQRFEEIWKDVSPKFDVPIEKTSASAQPSIQLGSLARGFICYAAKLVVVTDAEIFGRYKIQRARRAKSPHASAVRSAMEIDFADLEEGDLVVHLQHGIGKYLGLKNLAAGNGFRGQPTAAANLLPATECLVLEYAPSGDAVEPPKLYVPVSEAHLVSKYVGAGKANAPLNQLGGTRWAKAKEQTE